MGAVLGGEETPVPGIKQHTWADTFPAGKVLLSFEVAFLHFSQQGPFMFHVKLVISHTTHVLGGRCLQLCIGLLFRAVSSFPGYTSDSK